MIYAWWIAGIVLALAWASRAMPAGGPVIWTAVGAGIIWGAALWETQATV